MTLGRSHTHTHTHTHTPLRFQSGTVCSNHQAEWIQTDRGTLPLRLDRVRVGHVCVSGKHNHHINWSHPSILPLHKQWKIWNLS